MGAPCSTSSSHVGGGRGRHRAGTQTGGTGISSPRNERGLYRAHVLSNALPASAAEPAHPSQGRFRNPSPLRRQSPQSSPSHLSLGPLPGLPLSPPPHLHGPSPHSCQRGPRECGSDLALPWLPAERPLGIRPCPLLTPLPPPRARDPLPKPSPGSLLPALGDCALTPSPRDPPLPASPLTAFPHSP